MGWWKALKEQFDESWQELLYTLELTIAGSEDLPWLDTLNFFWDSLPDADKLTTAERRRLAHSVKLLVRQAVQDHYDKEVSQKHAILLRQLRRHQAQAEQHIQHLAEKRQAELQALSETARQQSMVLPPAAELDTLLDGLNDVSQKQLKQLTTEQYRQYLAHLQQDLQRRRSSPQAAILPATASPAVEAIGNEQVAVDAAGVAGEIRPATPASSSSGSRCSSPGRSSHSHQEKLAHDTDMRQPLLEVFGATDDSIERHQRYDAWDHHHHHQQLGGYRAPHLQQMDNSEPQHQSGEVVIDIKPLHRHTLMHSGSQLLLQRYLDASQPSVAVVRCAAAPDKQRREAAGGSSLQPTMSDASSDGGVVRTLSDSSSTADHSSVGTRNSISSSTVATPLSTYSSRAASNCPGELRVRGDSFAAVCKPPADTVVNVDQLLGSTRSAGHQK